MLTLFNNLRHPLPHAENPGRDMLRWQVQPNVGAVPMTHSGSLGAYAEFVNGAGVDTVVRVAASFTASW